MNIFKNIKNGIKATTPKEKKVVKGQDLPVISRILKNFAMDKDKGVIGGYNNSFPLSTATQGNVYFLPATGKYYYCQTSYNGTQISAPNSNFVEISVLANHDRLNNLNAYMFSEVKVHNVNSNNFSGKVYEYKSFYIFDLGSTSIITDKVTITHNLNIKFPPEIKSLPIYVSSALFPAQYAALKENEIFIQAPNNAMQPSVYIKDIIPKFID